MLVKYVADIFSRRRQRKHQPSLQVEKASRSLLHGTHSIHPSTPYLESTLKAMTENLSLVTVPYTGELHPTSNLEAISLLMVDVKTGSYSFSFWIRGETSVWKFIQPWYLVRSFQSNQTLGAFSLEAAVKYLDSLLVSSGILEQLLFLERAS